MSYQYEKLTPEARLAQLDANLEQLEQLLFQAEMSVKMNEWRTDDDQNLITLRRQYDENLRGMEAIKRMKVEIQGDGIIEAVTDAHARANLAPLPSMPQS